MSARPPIVPAASAPAMQIVNRETTLVPIDAVTPHPRNANESDLGAIHESVSENGFYGSLIVQADTGYILKGNHTWEVARQLGAAEIPVTYVDVDDERALRILLADNETARKARMDSQSLADLLTELADTDAGLSGTGFDGDDLDALLSDLEHLSPLPPAPEAPAFLGDPDAVPALPAEPISHRGDLWLLGDQHRLLVGDCTEMTALDRLMAGDQASLVWTDPPYGVDYVGVWHGQDKVRAATRNDCDDEAALRALWRDGLTNAWTACRPGAAWYVAAPAKPMQHLVACTVLRDLGVWRHTLIWAKSTFVVGRADYHYQFEHVFYGWREDGTHYFVDDRSQGNVWTIDRPASSADHPTTKPIELVARALRNSSLPGDVVLDCFAGSGTTLLACVQEGRRARLIELDEKYADVICRRFQQVTGIMPLLESTGTPHDFLS